MNVTSSIIKSVMKAIYNLSDEDNYNVYDAEDIADYLGLDKKVVDEAIATLFEAGCLGECMNLHDDGVETYYLTDKAIDLVELG
jgi:DNA-binding MarR family transcriptional regulator